MANNEEQTDRLRRLRRELYRRGGPRVRKKKKILSLKSYGVPVEWGALPKEAPAKGGKKKLRVVPSIFRKFFVFSLIVFVASLMFTFVVFYRGTNIVSSENIDIEVLGNAFVPGGEELSLQIEITNRNNTPLEFSDLLVEYPKGSAGDTLGDFVRVRESLGTIGSGETAIETVKVVLFGEEGSSKDIRVALEYRVKGSNAIFVQEKTFTVTISSAPLTLSIDAPQDTISGQEITLQVKITLNTDEAIPDLRLKIDYPPGFEFESATPEPDLGNTLWDLGDLSPGAEKTISITGVMQGQDGEERSFNIYSGSEHTADPSKIGVVFNSLLHTVAIGRPFIDARILVEGAYQDEYVSSSQTDNKVEIAWSNNLQTRIDDVEIKVTLSGNALDEASVSTRDGFYNSLDNTIVWNKSTLSTFSSIAPGERDDVSFNLSSLPLLTGTQTFLERPQIVIEVSIKGTESTEGLVKEVVKFERRVIKIVSDFQIAAKALHYTGPFTNTGLVPPKVGQDTTYTIVWNVTNSSNKISEALAKATLPLFVRFNRRVSPSSENVLYDESTREVTWNIGKISEGAGLLGESKEVSFQVTLLPSLSQVGTAPELISGTTLTGRDTFANTLVQSRKSPLNTNLINDSGFVLGQDKVVQ